MLEILSLRDMRFLAVTVLLFVGLFSIACSSPAPEVRRGDANTPAGKAGQAAHKVAVEAGKAGRVIGRKLDKAAHDAHEGWKQAAQNDQQKR